jgi:mycoredoxin
MNTESTSELIVYGAYWCGDTRRTRDLLDEAEVTYTYIELDDDPEAADWVRSQNDGAERKPTLRLIRPPRPDAVLIVPLSTVLTAWLTKHKVS